VICTPEELMGESIVSRDPIVDEVRRVCEEQAARHDFNVKAILAASKKRQERGKHKIVSLAAKKKLSA
jgi:hypothetical protein